LKPKSCCEKFLICTFHGKFTEKKKRFYDRSIAHSIVHGGTEQDALSPEVSTSGAEERAILVQEPQGQE